MNMYEKRELRKNKKLENNDTEKSCLSVNINWDIGTNVKPLLNPYKY